MDGHTSNTGKNSIMEGYYKMIGEAHVENILENLSARADEIDKVTVPKSLDDWFDAFQKKRNQEANRKRWLKRMKKLSGRVAMVALIMIASMTVVTLSVDAFRIRFLNFMIDQNEMYTEFGKTEGFDIHTDPNISAEKYYYLSYLPDSFQFEKASTLKDSILMVYTDGENEIYFDQVDDGADYQLDTEGASIREVPIGDDNGQLIIKNNKTMLFWYSNTTSFILKGNVSEQELVRMAESLEKNK